MELKQVFSVNGINFDTKAEAMDYLRKPKIMEALNKLTGQNKDLADWLYENRETVESAFETGTIRRVTKSEYKKLDKALEVLKEIKDISGLSFLQENATAIRESFRWPSVKRMTDEEKATAAKNTLSAATEGNDELVEWILANKDSLLEAYQAGVEKRQVNPKAQEALAAYRAKKAAEKAAQEGGKTDEPKEEGSEGEDSPSEEDGE